ncbi:cell division protein ZapA [Lachnoclostridium sp. Marseille-P6806]|uniref:cell division protein ZapA n=1 Tax=Lachnoclostridium sp. Marseille-P6806 TaxID=2364793 RepID=UPI0010308CDC|nr:cell division protein ZapA [Lachnoclostridium sp. Marseille-P6806]
METPKNDTKVVIGGKVYTLSGYESEEYIQKIASYLNGKLEEMQREEGYRHISQELRSLLLEINIADDCFKMKRQMEALREEMDAKAKDLYDLKHELVTTQLKLETTEKALRRAQSENEEKAKKIVRLEAGQK